MVLDLALLGTGGMMPLPNRWLSSVLVRYGRHLILFDCGEATQLSLRAVGWGIKDIDLILISHVHGDHVLGLPGLLLTLGNSGRTEPVDILGPPGLGEVVRGLLLAAPLPFALRLRELASEGVSECVFELDGLEVSSAAGDHRVPCLGYRLDVRRGARFRPEAAQALGVPLEHWSRLQRGETVDGVAPDAVLGPPRRGAAVGMITDTRPTATLQALVAGVDVLFCEGTYGSDADQPRAVQRKHMTFREAATLARDAGVGRLVLTHFSPLVVDPFAHAATARSVFAEAVVGHDGLTLSVAFPADE